jgi:transmembrane sensor
MNKQIIDEAAGWFVEFSTGDADQAAKKAFDAWLRKSPEHVRVYLELAPIWDDGSIALPGDAVTADDLVALARGGGNVIALERDDARALARDIAVEEAATPEPRRAQRTWARGPLAIAASVAVLLVACAFVLWSYSGWTPTYETRLGEHRSVRLADGTFIDLNTRSRVRVVFTEKVRHVELLAGQALFRVARDPSRPFTVSSGATSVRAVGTEFDVYRRDNATTVTVVEGKVSVRPVGSGQADASDMHRSPESASSPGTRTADGPLLLSAGEQITVSAARPEKPRRADVAAATAWTEGRLIFDSTPLPEVAEEFNRYNERTIIVDTRTLGDFHVNGSFKSSDPASLIRFLREQPGLSIDETSSTVRISHE